MEFSRQEYWSGLSFPTPGHFPNPGMEPKSPAWQVDSLPLSQGFPGGTSGKKSACQCRDAKDLGSIPGSGTSLAEGNGYPLQYSCLENSMDRGA